MAKDIDIILNDIPFGVSSKVEMTEPNQSIKIYEGIFLLASNNDSIEVTGKIWFDWFPIMGTKFSGVTKTSYEDLMNFTKVNEHPNLIINDLTFGETILTNIKTTENIEISGQMNGFAVLGDKSIPISKITFSIPNLRDFYGLPIRKIDSEKRNYVGRDRIVFENEDYKIIIDKSQDYNKSFESLKANGGYFLLYSGEIEKKSGHISFEELNKLHYCLSTFLSFLNDQRCSPLFLKGVHDEAIVWTDYTGYTSDLFKHVHSWPQNFSINGLNELWNEFYKLWNNEDDKDFLISAIHWYLEGNSNSGYLEGSIVMIQTALELVYNWFIIEKKKLIYGKDGENISTSNKIRLLLSHLIPDIEFPKSFTNMKSYLESNNIIPDEIEVFVQIRNAIIHSQEEKRKKLSKIPNNVMYEAQQLGLWYIEISLLKILNFKEKYRNRCSGKLWSGEDEEYLINNQNNK